MLSIEVSNVARKNFNTTIDEATIATIDRLAVGRSKGEVIDAAVTVLAGVGKPDLLQKIYERTNEILIAVESLADHEIVEITKAPNPPASLDSLRELVAPTAPKAPTAIKRYKCDHCGVNPAVARVGDICQTCREGGHRLDMRDCPRCGDYGTGAL